MKINPKSILIKDIVNGYANSDEEGVIGYDGKLNIRPKYQREFIYDDKKRKAVINTILNEFPLNVIYWAKNGNDTFEVLDGQQRTISICQFYNGEFSIVYDGITYYYFNLPDTLKEKFNNYSLMVYVCEGNDKEKLDWFKIVNIAGVRLTDQELLNAVYTGEWLTDAKRYFSKTNCAAYGMAKDYLNGTPIRQEYLETVLNWISAKENTTIETYMALHQHDANAFAIWQYFISVINWVKAIFPNYRKEMKGIQWGILFNEFGNNPFDAAALEEKIKELMQDEDISKKSGIYSYLLDGDERHLNIRAFTPKMKREAYERQNGICSKCLNHFALNEMQADHITPWHLGGATIAANCQMLCADCNRKKSGI